MFSPNNNPFPKSPLPFPSYYDLQNPSHGDPPFFFPFPSPFPGDNRGNDHDTPLGQIFSQHRHLPGPNHVRGGETAGEGKKVIKKKRPAGSSGLRRRTGKKDRHSKICTAQGVRDRRMRLSLHVARRFFDLQDMLGFDKASKTIEWLLSKSECAIRELITSPSSCSEEGNNNKSEATEGKNVFFGKNAPMERTKEKAMVYEHCSNPTMISPFEEKEEEGEEGDYNMIITNNGNFMGFLGNWEMAPF